VAFELSVPQAPSLQQACRVFARASCYIYLIPPRVTVISILPTLAPPEELIEQKKELASQRLKGPQRPPASACQFVGVEKPRAWPQATQGVEGRAEPR